MDRVLGSPVAYWDEGLGSPAAYWDGVLGSASIELSSRFSSSLLR